ncbi:SAM-dependent methyltransferase [Paractinoplanes hotanensis]|uniref:Class I SAM-dependent methyltransferase n=1 Tax=Paractinoplanes hotanensis TaxID=2906497 RepID=A0ABT0YC04_9ACTN|nr:class I SAM-dependent methyltransferase [Actinoplanes hotanensis]MCM4083572.1 class I SAM-dependent methyltransferase [Actinoplanes hotanensis]
MTDKAPSEQRFADAVQAAQQIEQWSTGAQALALLTAVREWGWTRFLSTSRDIRRLAEFTGLTPAQLETVLDALRLFGVVEHDGTEVWLSPTFAALAADDAWLALPDVLDNAEVSRRLIQGAVPATHGPLSAGDALVVARTTGGRPTTVTAALFERLLRDLPEWAESLREGNHLDVGSGIATATLTLSSLFPQMRTTAIELVPEVAAEARRRAEQHGLAGRVDVRCMDARDFPAEGTFDSAFWDQPFFPEPTRTATLAMIRRALRPGALLSVPEEDAEAQDIDERSGALRRLLRAQWRAPRDRSAAELAAEAEEAGFTVERVAPTSFGRFVLLRRPADVAEPGPARR